jgi:methyl-accepting chemotaxis protein
MEQIHDSAKAVSDILFSAVEEPMSIGDNEGTVNQLRKVAEKYKTVRAFLTNYKGNITYSTHPDTLRKDFTSLFQDQKLGERFAKSLKSPLTSGLELTVDGPPGVCGDQLHPQREELPPLPWLQTAHPGQHGPPAGHQPAARQARRTLRNSGLISLAGAAALLSVLLLFLRRMGIGKIVQIALASDRIRKGDYNADLQVVGNDELAALSTNLKAMVSTVQDQLEYNRSILKGIILPLFVADHREVLTYINAPMRNILGKSEADCLGETVTRVFYDKDDKSSTTAQVIASGRSRTDAWSTPGATGWPFPCTTRFRPSRTPTTRWWGPSG